VTKVIQTHPRVKDASMKTTTIALFSFRARFGFPGRCARAAGRDERWPMDRVAPMRARGDVGVFRLPSSLTMYGHGSSPDGIGPKWPPVRIRKSYYAVRSVPNDPIHGCWSSLAAVAAS
jgi:hypothetical protein